MYNTLMALKLFNWVNFFEKSGAELTIHLKNSAIDQVGQLVDIHLFLSRSDDTF